MVSWCKLQAVCCCCASQEHWNAQDSNETRQTGDGMLDILRHYTRLLTFSKLDGTVKPCVVSRMLSTLPEDCNMEEEETLIEDSAGNMYQGKWYMVNGCRLSDTGSAGSDTVRTCTYCHSSIVFDIIQIRLYHQWSPSSWPWSCSLMFKRQHKMSSTL